MLDTSYLEAAREFLTSNPSYLDQKSKHLVWSNVVDKNLPPKASVGLLALWLAQGEKAFHVYSLETRLVAHVDLSELRQNLGTHYLTAYLDAVLCANPNRPEYSADILDATAILLDASQNTALVAATSLLHLLERYNREHTVEK